MKISLLIALACVSSAMAVAGESKSLKSFKTGYFYTSGSSGDGAVQLSECAKIIPATWEKFKNPYRCTKESVGFRCASPGSLDVVFVFDTEIQCQADRKNTLNAPEEG
jgi:hypothetical protein